MIHLPTCTAFLVVLFWGNEVKKLILVAALSARNVGAQAASGERAVGDAVGLHLLFTEIFNAEAHCPGLAVDLKKWTVQMSSTGGSEGRAMLKAFNASEQGGGWYDKRENEFRVNPAKNCAEAEQYYGPKGNGLLTKK